MQPSSMGEEFGDLLGRLLAETHTSVRRLERLSGVSRRTLENWLNGPVRRPRHWEPVLRVAQALHLPEAETDALLRAGGLPPLSVLQATHRAGPYTDLLATWQPPPGALLGQMSPRCPPITTCPPRPRLLWVARNHSGDCSNGCAGPMSAW